VCQQSNASTIITMPSSSHTAVSSGAGGLCAVRSALTPMLRISVICRRSASTCTTAPSGPWVACRSTPRSFIGVPLSEKPVAGSNVAVRMPKVVVVVSVIRPATTMSVRSE
jgi:hypothetical protein